MIEDMNRASISSVVLCDRGHPRPTGVLWHHVTPEMRERIPLEIPGN